MDRTAESLLIQEVLSGNKDEYAHLVNRYKRPLYNLAFRMTANGETAQDLAQETFVRAYANLHRYKPEMSFFSWLYTICLNLTRNHLGKKREVLAENAEGLTAREGDSRLNHYRSPETMIMEQQDIRGLEEALVELPVDLREAIVLRYMQELPFDDVAITLGISLSAAKMRVYRGLEKLRVFLMERRDSNEI